MPRRRMPMRTITATITTRMIMSMAPLAAAVMRMPPRLAR
jgi:hypothetical protein